MRRKTKSKTLVIIGIVVFLCVVIWLTALVGEYLITRLPASIEKKLGNLYSSKLLSTNQSSAEGAAQAYLQNMVDRLAKDLENNPYTFVVAIDCSPQVNAFAFPGGLIVVLHGLLTRIESEEELAMLLGHEMGHHVHRHHVRAIGRSLGVAAILMMLGFSEENMFLRNFAEFTGNLMLLKYSRDHERQADDTGLQLVLANYTNAEGALDLFRRFGELRPKLVERIPAWTMTHPHPKERLNRLQQRISSTAVGGNKTPLPDAIFANICK